MDVLTARKKTNDAVDLQLLLYILGIARNIHIKSRDHVASERSYKKVQCKGTRVNRGKSDLDL